LHSNASQSCDEVGNFFTAFHIAQRNKSYKQTAQGFDNYGSSLITLCSIKTGDGR